MPYISFNIEANNYFLLLMSSSCHNSKSYHDYALLVDILELV